LQVYALFFKAPQHAAVLRIIRAGRQKCGLQAPGGKPEATNLTVRCTPA
jgi:hypothetical protein